MREIFLSGSGYKIYGLIDDSEWFHISNPSDLLIKSGQDVQAKIGNVKGSIRMRLIPPVLIKSDPPLASKDKIKWKGKGLNEKGFDQNNNCIIQIDKRYLRPLEVHNLKGDFTKAKKILKWRPKRDLNQLVEEMIEYELKNNGQ